MQILFVHPNFPAQFGHIASRLAARHGVECVFLSRTADGPRDGIRCLRYALRGGATRANHYCSRTFENAVWNAHAVYEACKAAPGLRPQLIVGHSGFGSTVFLQELYDCPIVSYFEYYYRPHGTDMDFRPDFPPRESEYLRAHARNAMILLDLEACAAGYAPTRWQWSLLPTAWAPKVEVIHDGIDTAAWQRRPVLRRIGAEWVDETTRIVTYVSRGLEAMRGFDIFMRVASRIAAAVPNVLFVVVGSDRIHYGNDARHIKTRSFREHVLRAEQPDLRRFRFLGTVPAGQLADLLSLSDLHVYLSVPFVLSWSLLNALACECTVLASDVAPVREVISQGQTGLLAEFFDVEGLASQAIQVLKDPPAWRKLGTAGRALVEDRYSLEASLPRHWELFRRVAGAGREGPKEHPHLGALRS
ncbi:MAG TPA: glycosyltransferase [Methylomirabilota bacterium]|nr:glycosyltransferase [Methylomirabilota bacterium]